MELFLTENKTNLNKPGGTVQKSVINCVSVFHIREDEAIHEKKDFCGGDGYLGKKNWRKIWPKNGIKWPKMA